MKTLKIKSIKKITSKSKKYDVQVSKNNNFFGNNILLHNSLIISFYYKLKMEWIIASRGSFISEQAIEASKMINTQTFLRMDKENTYLYEIIYNSNRIVVDYGDMRDLVLLGVINTSSGDELSHKEISDKYSNLFMVVKKYDIPNVKKLSDLQELEEENREGFVIRFENGFRVKVKFSEYVRLHRILTNVST